MDFFSRQIRRKNKPAFEGWFCKIDDPSQDCIWSVIWGYSTHSQSGHAFLMLNGTGLDTSKYLSFPLKDMQIRDNPFVLQVGPNILSKSKMIVDIEQEEYSFHADLVLGSFARISANFFRPNIMGWLHFFPNECNHAIISMKHQVNGSIQVNKTSYELKNASGYIEKDWGTNFPKSYVWVQANDWKDASIVFSYATVPMLGGKAKGFFLLIHYQSKEYRFSSIEGSRLVEFESHDLGFVATIQKSQTIVTLEAVQFNPQSLPAPKRGQMIHQIKESIDGKLILEMKQIKKNRCIIHLESNRASIDVHMNQ